MDDLDNLATVLQKMGFIVVKKGDGMAIMNAQGQRAVIRMQDVGFGLNSIVVVTNDPAVEGIAWEAIERSGMDIKATARDEVVDRGFASLYEDDSSDNNPSA